MKKGKGEMGSNSMDRISELPKEILQRIMYFLSQEDAVRTSVLSKSWRYIWCTRPNLVVSDATSFKGNIQAFLCFVDNTLQRYCDQRVCLEEFRLCISLLVEDNSDHKWVEKWIPLLTTMGVKHFQLSIGSDSSPGIIDLPSVVFEAESLTLLDLNKCNLGQKIPENISFVGLQVLRLDLVLIRQEIFDKIISSCPLLTTLQLEFCEGLKSIKLEKKLHKYLKHFTFMYCGTDQCDIVIDVPTLETIKVAGSKVLLHAHKFNNLKYLILDRVELSSNLIEQSQLLCIDAPNIEYFHCLGSFIPSISFAPTCRTSLIALYIRDVDDAESWFLRLSKLLQALRRSVILLNTCHLSVDNMHVRQDILVQDIINGGNKPVVIDSLLLSFVYVPPLVSFLNGLFCICRPRNIHPTWFPQGPLDKEREKKELSEFCCMIKMIRESGNREIWQDLEDLTIESFDESLQQWQPLQVTTLSECALPDFDRCRVRLQWSDQACECSP